MTVEQLRAAALAKLQASASNLLALLRAEERELLREAFERADKNGDGKVSRAELRESIGATSNEDPGLDALPLADLDGDGELDFEELLVAQVQRKLAASEEQAWNTFSHFDVDADGFVDRSELARLSAAGASPESITALLADADEDGDGRINYDEFLAWYLSPSE